MYLHCVDSQSDSSATLPKCKKSVPGVNRKTGEEAMCHETAEFRDLVKAEAELNEPKVRAFAEGGGVGGGETRKL